MEVPGSLGITIGGTRLVEIPNRPGYVYVRIRDQLSEVVAAYNDQVSPIYDLPVLITRERTNRNRWKIKGRDLGRYEGWGSTAFLPNHHDQHEFNPIAPGGDVVWVYAQQIMPLAATPSGSSGAMSLIVKDFTYYRNSDWKYFPDTSTASFTPYKPTGSSAVMVLLYLNTSDNLAYADGVEFAITTGTANIVPHIPDEPADCFIPIAGIYLLSGTSALTWDNIYEARPFFGSTATGTSGTGTDEKVKVSSDDTTANYLENKIVAGNGVAITTLSGGGNETLSIAVTNTGTAGTPGAPGAAGAPGSNTLLLYDNSIFKVTGSAISFEGGLDVSITGSVAFVTWTGSSGGVGTVLYTKWDVDAPPASPSIWDDEFDNSSLDAKWAEYDEDGEQTVTEDAYGLKLIQPNSPGATNVTGIYQSVPTGTYTVTVKGGSSGWGAGTTRWGLALWDNAPSGTADIWTSQIVQYDNGVAFQLVHYKDRHAVDGTFMDKFVAAIFHNPMYLRVRWHDAATTHWDISHDGLHWTQMADWSVNCKHMGLFIDTEAGAQQLTGLFDFFRVENIDVDTNVPCKGQRINVYS